MENESPLDILMGFFLFNFVRFSISFDILRYNNNKKNKKTMEDFLKQQRRMNMFFDALIFMGIAFALFAIICRVLILTIGL